MNPSTGNGRDRPVNAQPSYSVTPGRGRCDRRGISPHAAITHAA
jgi:hypothetical protein